MNPAIRIRADDERKRLVDVNPLDHGGDAAGMGLYRPAMTAATYARPAPLRGGRQQRVTARRLAAERGVGFVILDFEVDTEVLRQRLRRRQALGRDASDADESVLAGQMPECLSLCNPMNARPSSLARLRRALRMQRLKPTGHHC